MQGHIFGRKYIDQWTWAHLYDPRSQFAFEGLNARGLAVFYFYYEGKVYHLNSILRGFQNSSQSGFDSWNFSATTCDLTFRGEIKTSVSNITGVTYLDTFGIPLYCHNSKLSDAKISVYRHDKLERSFEFKNLCAFEFVSRTKVEKVNWVL